MIAFDLIDLIDLIDLGIALTPNVTGFIRYKYNSYGVKYNKLGEIYNIFGVKYNISGETITLLV